MRREDPRMHVVEYERDEPASPPPRRKPSRPWLTWALIAAAVGITLLTDFSNDLAAFARFAISDLSTAAGRRDRSFADVRAGEIWRLVTPMFVHMTGIHLLFNAMWMRELGRMVEMRHGPLRFAGLALAIAIASNVAQYLWHGPAFGGLSGLVYGLFGYVLVRSRLQPHPGWELGRQNVMLMLGWFVLCFTGMVGPIANAAHAAGLGLGAAFGAGTGLAARCRRLP
jgi:GlpG protein